MSDSARFNTVVPSNVQFNPGSSIVFTDNDIEAPGGSISLLSNSQVQLRTGKYLINYAVSTFNNPSSVVKMMVFQGGIGVVSSFTSGPVTGGNGQTSGCALIVVTSSTSIIELRVDVLGGPVTPFSNVTMVVTNIT
ncbi:hypothetical protein [Paenibacillus sp.]|jgi:hypothetical protein|uniref:hypothetical protein n=1 Tax=Paenibacillus sp. TaxID=58172 RepID=UPI00282DDC45|nr:hypothetical protein [Paenibacillus sp.]MDR0267811.1 hypothetical protein [Paenibacillus sp.]